MTKASESLASTSSSELLEEVRESAKVGQHATAEALRKFRRTLDEAIPEAVHPLRTKIVDAAIELADTLANAQYQFNRNLIRSTDRALSAGDDEKK
jgi:precorrin-6x reductase